MEYATAYWEALDGILSQLRTEQAVNLDLAASLMVTAITGGGIVHVFGSGHSMIPALDIFPRYGSYPVFHPLLDPRLMWFNVFGPGGTLDVLSLERQEGHAATFLQGHTLLREDVMLVFSHGGVNAAPVEVALEARQAGLRVVAVTSLGNRKTRRATHSTGLALADLADVVIDNCVPAADALVSISGDRPRVAAGSTVAVVAVAMVLLAEVAGRLQEQGIELPILVAPGARRFSPEQNEEVWAAYRLILSRRGR